MRTLGTSTRFALVLFTLFLYASRTQATDLSGNITSTITITQDSQLMGDVTCAVPQTMAGANPCIAFGFDHIKLKLNGHTITGPVDPPTGCSVPGDSMFGVGIEASGRTDVKIEGPGVIQKFERWGIFLSSSTDVTVRNVTANRNCWSGMQTISTSDSHFEENRWINNAAGSNGAACGGICMFNSNRNVIHKSTFYGNGSLDTGGNVDFGVGLEASAGNTSNENRIEDNDIGGNTNGVLLLATTSNTISGNIVRRNIIAGNPAAQVIKTFTATNQTGADIHDLHSSAGANTFADNFCLTYIGAGTAPCPNIKTEGVEEAANRLGRPRKDSKGPMASLLANPYATANRQRDIALASLALLPLAFVVTLLKISSSRSRKRSSSPMLTKNLS
jgi:parallel beta-helix repeat protein